jgi:hypothetical protein
MNYSRWAGALSAVALLLSACGGGGGGGSSSTSAPTTPFVAPAGFDMANSSSSSLSSVLASISAPTIVGPSTADNTYLTVWTGPADDRQQLTFMTVSQFNARLALPSDSGLQIPLGTTVVSYEFYNASGTLSTGGVTL